MSFDFFYVFRMIGSSALCRVTYFISTRSYNNFVNRNSLKNKHQGIYYDIKSLDLSIKINSRQSSILKILKISRQEPFLKIELER